MSDVYGKFNKSHLALTKEGLDLFNDQKYWECHEVFEDLWKEDVADKARYIWWAIIQVAAAMIHYRDKNIIGARGLINKTKDKLRKIEEFQVRTEYVDNFLDWEELEKLVWEVPEDPELTHFAKLFEFRFKSYLNFHEYVEIDKE